jgi:integrase
MDTSPRSIAPNRQHRRSWSEQYGEKHRAHRITVFGEGINPPQRVRVYRRTNHYVLQWWDPIAKRTLADRINGDLVAAVARAREIDKRLTYFKGAGGGHRKLKHSQIVEKFLLHMDRRADAGECSPATVRRYKSSLAHYLAFAEQIPISKEFPHAGSVNREFQLKFAANLAQRQVARNGHPNASQALLVGQQHVADAVRTMFQWAASPDGNLLPEAFRNPFLRRQGQRAKVVPDQFGEPDLTVSMAVNFIQACDLFQLRLFAPMSLWGLRAAEPAFIFREEIDHWVKVRCLGEIGYVTKGRRDKRFPLMPVIHNLLQPLLEESNRGLLYVLRSVAAHTRPAPLAGATLAQLGKEFQRRCKEEQAATAARRESIRTDLIRSAGGMSYHNIDDEFQHVRRRLGWPPAATLKDFRHLFSTCLENAGMPQYYRRYLMGQAPGRDAIVAYTHLNELRERYVEAIERTMQPIVDAASRRLADLSC